MARATNKTASNQTPTEQPVQVPPVAQPVVESTGDESVQKAKKQKKSKTVEVQPIVDDVKPEKVVEPVQISNDVVEDVPVDSTTVGQVVVEVPFNNTLIKLNEFGKKINDLTAVLSSLKLEYKTLEKGIGKDIKTAQKHLSKGKKNGGVKRAPTGFVKPTLISDELAKFLNLEPGTELGRTAASKEVHNYIKAHQLNKGRTIHPDAVLAKILNYTEGVSPVLTYLNLQTFLKHHFIGNKVSIATPEVVA
jgi:hypothetical protein